MFYERTLEKNALSTSDHRTRHLYIMMNNVVKKKGYLLLFIYSRATYKLNREQCPVTLVVLAW